MMLLPWKPKGGTVVKTRGGIVRARSREPLWVVGGQLSTVPPRGCDGINGSQEPWLLIGGSDHPALTLLAL